jgi:general secretion pathway protein I
MNADHQEGFTLLEVMIALAILASVLVVLLGLRNRDGELHRYAADLLEATLLAKQKMTDQELAGFPELGELSGSFGEENPRFSWREVVSATPFDSVREIQVAVLWKRGEREESVGLTAYFVKNE